jgi:protocatechuate 3,4-dioxygenase, alpha subunit
MTVLGRTPSQTVGPYFSMRLSGPGENVLAGSKDSRRIRFSGAVYDGDGKPIDDALVELWQADAEGRYRHPADNGGGALSEGFLGFGRSAIDAVTGLYWFDTVKPGRVLAPDGSLQAPHLSLVVQARGMLRPAFTRAYFPEETASNAQDFVLSRIPAERRRLLIAERDTGAGPPSYRFDIRLQGADEAVFFAF